MNHSYRFFQNKDCEFFPCHNIKTLNCLFCFCPLYHLDCGGDYKVLANGIKDCSDCNIPHGPNGYDYVIEKLVGRDDSLWQSASGLPFITQEVWDDLVAVQVERNKVLHKTKEVLGDE